MLDRACFGWSLLVTLHFPGSYFILYAKLVPGTWLHNIERLLRLTWQWQAAYLTPVTEGSCPSSGRIRVITTAFPG